MITKTLWSKIRRNISSFFNSLLAVAVFKSEIEPGWKSANKGVARPPICWCHSIIICFWKIHFGKIHVWKKTLFKNTLSTSLQVQDAKSCQKMQRIAKGYKGLPKIHKIDQGLPKVATSCQSCQHDDTMTQWHDDTMTSWQEFWII